MDCASYLQIKVVSSIITNVPLWWGMDIDMGEVVQVEGQGIWRKSVYFPVLNSDVKLKLF